MSKKEQIDGPLGAHSAVFKGRKPEEGDVILRVKKRYRPKGKALSGAAKMKAAYLAKRTKRS